MHIVVTGGCGFIGSHLTQKFLDLGYRVTVVDDQRQGTYMIDHSHVKYKIENVMEASFSEPIHAIFHLANTPRVRMSFDFPVETILNGVGPTTHVAEWARNHKCPLYFACSSSTIHSDKYSNPYTFSKCLAEDVLNLYEELWGIRYYKMFFYNVYGPGEADYGPYSTVIRAFKTAYLEGTPLKIFGNGSKQRDFTHVNDVVNGMANGLLDRKMPQEAHFGSSNPYSIKQIADLFDTRIVYEFDKPGEAQTTYCANPYIQIENNVLDYVKTWIRRKNNAKASGG